VAVALLVGLGTRTPRRRVGAAGGVGRHRPGPARSGCWSGWAPRWPPDRPCSRADRAQPDGAGHGPAR
jgi:hypothetical protein